MSILKIGIFIFYDKKKNEFKHQTRGRGQCALKIEDSVNIK